MPKYTEKQLEAINTRGANLLVTAAAGSGKTAVLIERIIKMVVEENVDVDRLLVMTFTEAAAAEMKDRLYRAITQKLKQMPDNKHLQRQLSLMPKAYVMTIHSFCLSVIRKYFYTIDLDPNFRICDETEASLLINDAFNETLDEMFEVENAEAFARFYDSYGKSKETSTRNLIMKVYKFAMSTPYPELWLEEKLEEYLDICNKNFEDSVWAELIKEDLRYALEGAAEDLAKISDILNEDAKKGEYDPVRLPELESVKEVLKTIDLPLELIAAAFDTIEFGTLRLPKQMDEYNKDLVKTIRDDVKKRIRNLKELYFPYKNEVNGFLIKETADAMKTMCAAALRMHTIYTEKKRRKQLLDFDDLQHLCIRILTEVDTDKGVIKPSSQAKEIREMFHEILVDEYQDSNAVQETVFNAISKEDNLFVVGDMKQSIYRFRHANPNLFRGKNETYLEQDGASDRKVTLAKNFRSHANILKAVNYVFGKMMSEYIGEMEYGKDEYLYNGLSLPDTDSNGTKAEDDHLVEVHLVDYNSQLPETDEVPDVAYTKEEYEAVIVAKRICELVNSGYIIYDKKENIYRKIRYRDIAILLRNPSTSAQYYVNILNKMKIPVYCEAIGNYFETVEIMTMISTLEIIDNPYQDIALIATMRSPMFSFNANDLAKIRVKSKAKYFYDAVKEYAKSTDIKDETKAKADIFLKTLDKWHSHAKFIGTQKLIEEIYNETGYYSSVGAMYDGQLRQANLRLLSSRAGDYEKTSFKGLFSFINYVKNLRLNDQKLENAKDVAQNSDVVQIISMHKSKGLEYPVVFVSGLGHGFNLKDISASVLLHTEYGFAPDYINTEKRVRGKTILKNALSQVLLREVLSEELRVLYVAMTRARDKLILTGGISGAYRTLLKWKANASSYKISKQYMIGTKSFIDMLGPCFISSGMFDSYIDVPFTDLSYNENTDADWAGFINSPSTVKDANITVPNPIDLSLMEPNPQIAKQFEYEYEFIKSSQLPTKMTVTELKGANNRFDEDGQGNLRLYEEELKHLPDFAKAKEKEKSGAQMGTFIHYIMENLNILENMDADTVKAQLDNLCVKGLVAKDEVTDTVIEKICNFFNSKTGREVVKYRDSVKREIPFVMNVKAGEIFDDMNSPKYDGETVLVQGVIDCYYETPDGIVILDYKTDRIYNDIIELKDKYEKQLDYYEKAISGMTYGKVARKVIYSFSLNREIEW